MRDFKCYIYYKTSKNSDLTQNGNTACFAGLNYDALYDGREIPKYYDNTVYLKDFDEEKTKAHQKRLLKLVNAVTPCKIVTIGKTKYISYMLLPNCFDQNLIMLNFIRYLWNEPSKGFADKFFDRLKKNNKIYKDPMKRLLDANKEAVNPSDIYEAGHSNHHPQNKLVIKDINSILKFKGHNTSQFLCK